MVIQILIGAMFAVRHAIYNHNNNQQCDPGNFRASVDHQPDLRYGDVGVDFNKCNPCPFLLQIITESTEFLIVIGWLLLGTGPKRMRRPALWTMGGHQ
eukprot:m.355178 g.355178  ORF g.355178 m.355178 type:complete len:98 (+) comp77552_c0_seq1:136-429(+)